MADYREIVKQASNESICFALKDIKETLKLHKNNSEYNNKLWAEWDAYIVEQQKRNKEQFGIWMKEKAVNEAIAERLKENPKTVIFTEKGFVTFNK